MQTGSVGVGGGGLVTCEKLNFGVPGFTPRGYRPGFTTSVFPGVTVEVRYARPCPRRTSGSTRCREAVGSWSYIAAPELQAPRGLDRKWCPVTQEIITSLDVERKDSASLDPH